MFSSWQGASNRNFNMVFLVGRIGKACVTRLAEIERIGNYKVWRKKWNCIESKKVRKKVMVVELAATF